MTILLLVQEIHKMISKSPYIFSRTFKKEVYSDQVIIGLNLIKGSKEIPVSDIFEDGDVLMDTYSGKEIKVKKGMVKINTPF